MQADALRLARIQMDALECRQRVDREIYSLASLSGRAQVNLRHFVTADAARVLDLETHIKTSIGRRHDLQP